MADTTTEDFLDVPEDATPAYTNPETLSAPPRRRMPAAVTTGAWLAAGLVIGIIAVLALHSNSTNNAAGTPAASANQLPGGAVPPQGSNAVPGGGFGGAPAFGGGPGAGGRGGLPGEQHIVGTLRAVGSSSITVTSSSGTATYPIESSTVLVKDGQRVSSLSALQAGDTVVVHVYPSNGSDHVEIVIDGDPQGGFGFGGGRDGGSDDNNDGTTTTTET